MSVTNPAAIAMAIPGYSTDKIIGVLTGSFTSSIPSAFDVTYTEALIPHPFGDTVETQAVYNTGGVDNDQDMTVPRLTGAFPVFQTLDVSSYSTSSNIVIASTNWYDNVAGKGFAYTINYKVYLIAKMNQGVITPMPTNQLLRYRSSENYLKIVKQDVVPISVPAGTSSYTVTHGVNGIPRSRASIEYLSTGKLWGISPNQYPSTGSVSNNNPITTSTTMDGTSVTYTFGNSTAGTLSINLHYRIYLDD